MNRIVNTAVLTGIFLTLALSFQNCSQVDFKSDVGPASKSGIIDEDSCRVDMITSTKDVKVLFLIDTSGSNAKNNDRPGTDMGKVWRLNTINAFINLYGSKPNFHFGFATFQEDSAKPLIVASPKVGVFSNDSSLINQAIVDFQNTPDSGYTPYDAALKAAKDMITYDKQVSAGKDIVYVVVMISDGVPTNSSYTNVSSGDTNLANDVNQIMNLAPQQISVNTVYLFNDLVADASKTKYLQRIASLGKGTFIEANSQQTLQISDTIQVPKTNCD